MGRYGDRQSMIVLRPDQQQLKAEIYAAWNNGATDVLGVAVTGFGKSVVSSEISYEQAQLGAMQCVIAHRTELVSQMSMHVANRGIHHRIIAPKAIVAQIIAEHRQEFNGRSFINPQANCSVAGVDTLLARADDLKAWAEQVDITTTDEAHHLLRHNKWGKARAMFTRARGVGFTATPQRADGAGLGRHADGVFDRMVIGPDLRTVINMAELVDYEIVIPSGDFNIQDDALTPSGDYSREKMRKESKRSKIVGNVVANYCKYAFGKRAICFATDVDTANDIAKDFNMTGIAAAAVSADTPTETRREFIKRFRDGRLNVLVNVDLFGEGFDVPACEVVIMARPTASLGLYLQMFGRALRKMVGKLRGLIIDHVSNWKRHGFPDKLHFWTLDRRDKKGKKEPDPEDIPLTACRACSRPYERFYTCCPYCGAEPPLPAPGTRTLEQVDGDLMLLDAATIAGMRAATELETPASIAARVEHVAGEFAARGAIAKQMERFASQERLKLALAQWAAVERAKGRSDRETHKRLWLTLGIDVLGALALPRVDMDGLAATVEGWFT